MSVTMTEMAVLVLFYLVFISQIFLISVYYPRKLRRRIEYVLETYPPALYPKLYPPPYDALAKNGGRMMLGLYKSVNWGIAAIGATVLAAMALSGYSPDIKGGDEIFVTMYFFLQMSPLIFMEIATYKQYQLMRETNVNRTRRADLSPRRLRDFISPVYIAAAVLLYVAWVVFYLYTEGFGGPWEAKVYVTLAAITGCNLFFAGIIAKFMYGKKLDPHQSHKDQRKQIEGVVRVTVLASIGVSVFMIAIGAGRKYGLDIFDPVLTSIYLQLTAVFGIGLLLRLVNVQAIDFEVYKEDAAVLTS